MRPTRSYINFFHTGDTHTILETVTVIARFGLSVFVPGNIQEQAIAGLPGGPALPDTLECLSSVRGPLGQNVSSVFGYFRHMTRF